MTRPGCWIPLLAVLVSIVAPPSALRAQCIDADLDAALQGRIGLRIEPPRAEVDLRAAAELAARARARFDAGVELDALADLEAAYRLSGDADIAGMLGLSLRAAGRLPEAWLAMRAFLEGAAPSVRASLEARVRAAMGEIEARLGGVRFAGDLGASGQVLLGGRVIARLPLDASLGGPALRLAPGRTRLELRADGRVAQEIDVDLTAGQIANVQVDLPVPSGSAAADLGGWLGLLASPPSLDASAAAELAARGRAAFAAGHELDALADLEAAYRATGDASLAGMLGLSLKAAARLPEAWVALHVFLRDAPPDARASLDARVRAAIGELDAQLGRVAIDGEIGARGQLVLDGRVLTELPLDASFGGAVRLPPGRVHLQVRADGRIAQDLDVDVTAGALAQVHADLPVPSIGPAAIGGPVDADVPPAGVGLDPWPFVVVAGGLAVVLVIGGIVASVVNDNLNTDLGRLDCAATPALCDPIRGNLSISEAFEWVGYIGAGVGAIVAGTIAIVVAVTANASSSASVDAPDVDADIGCDEDDEDDDAPRAQRQQVTGLCAPWVADGAGIGCSMTF